MKYERDLVEHTARILHHHDTGRTLPPNTELDTRQRAVLDGYVRRAEALLPGIRVWSSAAVLDAHQGQTAEAA